MESCRVESPYELLGIRCPLINTSFGSCGWDEEYSKSREIRMWTRAKDLLYGYAVIWTFMCIPRLYYYIKQLHFKRFIFRIETNSEKNAVKQGASQCPVATYSAVKHYRDCGCPVCLASTEEMAGRFPVVGSCGHAICAECFAAMWNHGKLTLYPVSCPLCIAPIQKVTAAIESTTVLSPTGSDSVTFHGLDQCIRRYNLIFNGGCNGILPANRRTIWMFCVDSASRALRLGYFFVLFDRKMMNTVSFFLLHFVIAIVVEYFENAYLQSLLEHL